MATLTAVPRRGLLASVVIGLIPLASGCSADKSGPQQPPAGQSVAAELAGLERRYGARLGVYARDTGTGTAVAYQADDRFPMCSTYKVLAAAAVLHRGNSTGAIERLGGAAVSRSDNEAANLLVHQLGGPAGVTAYARTLGDHVTRLDRTEPTLNEALPGDPRDTTSARAIATDYEAVVVGTALGPGDRALVAEWLKGSTTGARRIRAAVPAGWTVGDKTGTGGYGTDNDVAIVWPPQRPPIALAVLSTRSTPAAPPDDDLIAAAARTALRGLGVPP